MTNERMKDQTPTNVLSVDIHHAYYLNSERRSATKNRNHN